MAADAFLRKTHRVIAIAFFLTIPPAGFFSARGDPAHPSFWVYLPLLPLFGLALTGLYLLVRPWVQRYRTRRAATQG